MVYFTFIDNTGLEFRDGDIQFIAIYNLQPVYSELGC